MRNTRDRDVFHCFPLISNLRRAASAILFVLDSPERWGKGMG